MRVNEPVSLKANYDYLAPDGSEIRLLCEGTTAGLCHCTLPAGQTSAPVKHRKVEELWYILEGHGEVWHDAIDSREPFQVSPGSSVVISPGSAFQFRASEAGPLKLLIATVPPWPGKDEAEPAKTFWA
jgi:mannose-6-phosphate isomerase-like protein (cupin superfamily)